MWYICFDCFNDFNVNAFRPSGWNKMSVASFVSPVLFNYGCSKHDFAGGNKQFHAIYNLYKRYTYNYRKRFGFCFLILFWLLEHESYYCVPLKWIIYYYLLYLEPPLDELGSLRDTIIIMYYVPEIVWYHFQADWTMCHIWFWILNIE